MSATGETLEERIDRKWLEAQAHIDPITHAWAVWDLDHVPDRVRFVSLLRDGRTVGYLLVWYGAGAPRAHWVSSDPVDGLLAVGLPQPPVIALVPERVAAGVGERLHAREVYPVDVLECVGRTLTSPDPRVRRLHAPDAPALEGLVGRNPTVETAGYAGTNLDRSPVWGAFELDRLVAVARVAVQLPAVWIVTGVFTEPSYRGRGLGREVTAAVTGAGLAAGARVALYVRADNAVAQSIYRELGFARVDRRIWIDGGVGLSP
ncbi:MAG: GNAT family N-acetyltransferase [Thermoplasmata archaeon]|nr:GNAT family N-acetyltransferase [Thermoplasmata archaeon]